LLERLFHEARATVLLVDARACFGAIDLGMAIADEAVRAFAPDSAVYRARAAAPDSDDLFRVRRSLAMTGIAVDDVRDGTGDALSILRAGIDVAVALAGDARSVLVIDHLGRMLAGLRAAESRAILGVLRAAWQANASLDLMMVDFAGGAIERALRDRQHPLFQAGRLVPVHRPPAEAIAQSPASAGRVNGVDRSMLLEAARLTQGVPVLAWQVVDRASELPVGDATARAIRAWQIIRAERAPLLAREWDLLRAVHPAAQVVTAAMSLGVRPPATIADKTVRDARLKLRGVGTAWQPHPRKWSLASPLLAAWIVEGAASRTLRRRRPARSV
jgi:hypothetical protein